MVRFYGLQLFADGGSGDGGAATGATAPAAGEQGVKVSDIVYGVQSTGAEGEPKADPTQPQQVSQDVSPEARQAKFDEMCKTEYKDLFDARVQEIVQRRLKNSKETVDKYNAMAPMLEMLAQKYGVKDSGDVQALTTAIEEDDSFYENEALKEGITVDQLKHIRKMERENASLRAAMEEQQMQESANQTVAEWVQQGQATKAIYPSFDLDAEMQNQQFLDLLKANIDVRTAYEVCHKDDIISGAMQFAAKTVEQKVVNNIASGRGRPSENGAKPQGAALVKSDVSQLTRADRAEINRRVARGEKIRF